MAWSAQGSEAFSRASVTPEGESTWVLWTGYADGHIDIEGTVSPTLAENARMLHEAIRSHRVVCFAYDGHERIAEPQALGIKDGRVGVLTYQIGGTSAQRSLPGWRLFYVDEITELELTTQQFKGARRELDPQLAFDEWLDLS